MNKSFSRNKCPNIVYFDNNATTLICASAAKVHSEWISCYNASTNSKIAAPSKQIIESATNILLSHCGVSSANYTAIFTSGATESNCFIIRACVKAYKKKIYANNSELKPHIVISAVEHPSIIDCVKDLEKSNDLEVSYVSPTIFGNILPEDVESSIKSNTCLVSIMYANNEIPVINNIREIGEIAHKYNIPMHSDCVQIFGKYKINMPQHNIDVLSASAHKFYGPKGVGILIINNSLIEGYGITAEISGAQQYGLRGGTENIPGIASMMTALRWVFKDRKKKNNKLYALRLRLLERLKKYYTFNDFANYLYEDDEDNRKFHTNADKIKKNVELVSLGPPEDKKGFILPNTVLLAICKNKGSPFCNVTLKKYLDDRGFVISIGSACHTDIKTASHVLYAINAPGVIRRGVIRVSFGDTNTVQEVDRFASVLKDGINTQCKDLDDDFLK